MRLLEEQLAKKIIEFSELPIPANLAIMAQSHMLKSGRGGIL
jgi:hypothetical protein